MITRHNPQPFSVRPSSASGLWTLLGAILVFGAISSGEASDDQRPVQKPPPGLQKLDETRQWELDVGEARALDLPCQARTQIITFEFSSKSDVSALVFKEEDAKGEEGLLNSDSKKALVRVRGTSGKMQVEVPAKTATRFILRDVNAATVIDLKLTNLPDTRDVQKQSEKKK
jgi:hypothetical protein